MIFACSSGEGLNVPIFLSTVTPGKFPTCWCKPVSSLNKELLPLLGLPTRAIFRVLADKAFKINHYTFVTTYDMGKKGCAIGNEVWGVRSLRNIAPLRLGGKVYFFLNREGAIDARVRKDLISHIPHLKPHPTSNSPLLTFSLPLLPCSTKESR